MARVGGYDLNLRALRAPAPGAMYDARSLTWKSAGRWWSMFGGQAALMLQVADPRVAAGVVQHSNWERDPFGRLIRTMQAMLSISFGSAEVSARSAEQLRQRHVTIAGSTAGGAAYAGTDTDTGAWVWATLLHTLVDCERRFVGRWTETDRERWYGESQRMAAILGVDEVLPAAFVDFLVWWDERVEALEPDGDSKAVAAAVIRPQIGRIPPKWWWFSSAIGLDLLPPVVRERLELPALMPASVGWVLRTEERSKRLVRVLPAAMQANPFLATIPSHGR